MKAKENKETRSPDSVIVDILDAVEEGKLETVKHLVENHGVDVNAKYRSEATALMYYYKSPDK